MEPIRRFLLEPLHDLSSSVPMPWRVAIVLGPPLLLALLLVPRLLRLLLELLSAAIEGLGRAYAWIEYQLVRPLRRRGHQPWSLVGTLDDGVEQLTVRSAKAARGTARSPLLRRAVRTTLFVPAALPCSAGTSPRRSNRAPTSERLSAEASSGRRPLMPGSAPVLAASPQEAPPQAQA